MDPIKTGKTMAYVQRNILQNVSMMESHTLDALVAYRMNMPPKPYTQNRDLANGVSMRLTAGLPSVPAGMREDMLDILMTAATQNLWMLLGAPDQAASFRMLAEQATPLQIVQACYAAWEAAMAFDNMMKEALSNES